MNIISCGFNRIFSYIINRISPVLPVKNNRVYVSSFNGNYSDSPKQVALELKKMHPGLEVGYLVFRENNDISPLFVRLEKGSIKNAWFRATAHIIIDNVFGSNPVWQREASERAKKRFNNDVNKKKKKQQYNYTSWHGTPLKRMGIDIAGNDIVDFDCPYTTMILGNQFTARVMDRLMFQKVPIQVLGTPRNDLLFNTSMTKKTEIKSKFGISEDKKVLLYAPTFRDQKGEGSGANIKKSGLNQIAEIDFNLLLTVLSSKFGGDWVVILRFHYHVERSINWDKLNEKNPNTIINGNKFEDMAEYLQITDLLVTDASSCMFDFALTLNPCLLYFPDVEEYVQERGLYFDFDELPFPMAQSFDKFIDLINELDLDLYKFKCRNMLNKIGNVDDGAATKRFCSLVLTNHFSQKYVDSE